MRTVLAYDISSNRRRAKFFKRLKAHLMPVQESVFEGEVNEAGMKKVEKLVHKELDLTQDAVRVYRLCAGCSRLVRLYGISVAVADPDDPKVF